MPKIIGSFPYENYYVYGPYLHSKEKRYYLTLYPIKLGEKRSTISNARYIMSTKLRRILTDEEQVDHINNDCSDDRIENLQILTKEDNKKKHLYSSRLADRTVVILKCPSCQKIFEKNKRSTHLSRKGVFTSCSKSCCGKLRRKLQMGVITAEEISDGNVIEIKIKKYGEK